MNYTQLDSGNALDLRIKRIKERLNDIDNILNDNSNTDFWIVRVLHPAIHISKEAAQTALLITKEDLEKQLEQLKTDFESL